jgi:hypothetical protein
MEDAKTDRRAEADAHEKLRIGCVQAFEPGHDPHQKKGRNHEEADDKDVKDQVAETIHPTCGRDISRMDAFHYVPADEQARGNHNDRGISEGNVPKLSPHRDRFHGSILAWC